MTLTADRYMLAVGTRPHRPASVPFDGERILDSDEVLEIIDVPRTLAVVGAGVIGVEYATIFSALDVPVTLIEPRTTMLDFIDRELIDEFTHDLRDRGMVMRLGSAVETIERTAVRRLPDPARRRTLGRGRHGALCGGPGRRHRQPQPRRLRARVRPSRPAQGRSARPSRPACRTSMPRAT